MRWTGHVARTVEKGTRIGCWKARGKEATRKTQDVGAWVILGWIFQSWDGVIWTGLVWLRIGTGGEVL
jgi:hypothetical protein